MHKPLDHFGRGGSFRGEHCAKAQTWLTKLDTKHSHAANCELPSDEFIQANAACDQIAVGDGEIVGTAQGFEESLDLLRFNQSYVPTRLVVTPEVAIATNTGAGNELDR
jgi:hypothetical protein